MSNIHNWARLMKSPEDIPEEFRVDFDTMEVPEGNFPYVIYSPPDQWGSRWTNAKLTCLADDKLYVMEKASQGIKKTVFLPQNISYIERRVALLHSWIKICGIVNGQTTTLLIEFNTVVKALFQPVVESLRRLCNQVDHGEKTTKTDNEPYLKDLEYRFRIYANECIFPESNIRKLVFQPLVKTRYMHFFKKVLSGAHLHLVTDKEHIAMIEGEEAVSRNNRYEDRQIYIPVRKITNVSFIEDAPELYRMVLHVTPGFELSFVFSGAKQSEMKQLG